MGAKTRSGASRPTKRSACAYQRSGVPTRSTLTGPPHTSRGPSAVASGTMPSRLAATRSSGSRRRRMASVTFTPRSTRSPCFTQAAMSRFMRGCGSSTVRTMVAASSRSMFAALA